MPRDYPILVIGSFMQDLCWTCRHFPSPGETLVGAFRTGAGGKGSNQAIAAFRAGGRVKFVGAVGDDVFGAEAKALYTREGIAAQWITDPKRATGTAGILIEGSGQNEIVIAAAANESLRFSSIDHDALARAKVAVFQWEINPQTTQKAMAFARKKGVTTILNPAPMRSDATLAWLKDVDIFVPNETEFVALLKLLGKGLPSSSTTPADLPDDALHSLCRDLAIPTIVVTLGAAGVFVSRTEGYFRIAGHRVKVVDTTGAGDAFVGALAAGLVAFSGNLEKAVAYGNAAAALSVTKPGTSASMPTASAISRQLGKKT